jgi:hypothetical protein
MYKGINFLRNGHVRESKLGTKSVEAIEQCEEALNNLLFQFFASVNCVIASLLQSF